MPSKQNKLKTLLIGFGKIGQAYSKDPVMKKVMQYATHAEVLMQHDRFDWVGVVDPDPIALELARKEWSVSELAAELHSIGPKEEIEVAVLATPPNSRQEVLELLPNLKAIIVEKPIGLDYRSACQFVTACQKRSIKIQTNFLRRVDRLTRELALQKQSSFGEQQFALGIYSNGLLNNGIHIVDLARLFFGEVVAVKSDRHVQSYDGSPIPNDLNIPVKLYFSSGLVCNLEPVRLSYYRENGLDIWYEKGRLSYLNSGFAIKQYPLKKSSLVEDEKELELVAPIEFNSTLGTAFYELYSNLADAVQNDANLFADGEEALRTTEVVEAIISSYKKDERVLLEERANVV